MSGQRKIILSTLLILLLQTLSYAQEVPQASGNRGFVFDTNMFLAIIAVMLLIPVWMISNTFITAARHHYENKLKSGGLKLIIPLLLISSSLLAEGTPEIKPAWYVMDKMTILLLCVIGIEMLMLFFFAQKTSSFIRKMESPETLTETQPGLLSWLKAKWVAMNFKPIEEEHKIDTRHSYDGIRELDNVIPPWFTTAFLLTILFAGVYLYRYHIAKSAPSQIQEYETAVALAEVKQEEFLKKQANSVDESNVPVMTGSDIDAGKKTFISNCAACHKSDGGGLVGPNLTDEYWLHGGALKDIFKTIKYGYPEKGMISWKDQLTPLQIAQVANFVLTFKGTHPTDPKAKQGTLYVPDPITTDTAQTKQTNTEPLTNK